MVATILWQAPREMGSQWVKRQVQYRCMIRCMTYWCVLRREWMGCWGNGIIIDSDYGSFPHSLLSTSKMMDSYQPVLMLFVEGMISMSAWNGRNDDVCPSYFKKWATSTHTDVFVSEFHLPNATWKSSNVFRESSWYRFKLVGGKTAGTRGFPWTYPGSGWTRKEETSQLPVPVALVSQKPCNRKPQLGAKWSRRRISISPVFFSFGSFHKWGNPKIDGLFWRNPFQNFSIHLRTRLDSFGTMRCSTGVCWQRAVIGPSGRR